MLTDGKRRAAALVVSTAAAGAAAVATAVIGKGLRLWLLHGVGINHTWRRVIGGVGQRATLISRRDRSTAMSRRPTVVVANARAQRRPVGAPAPARGGGGVPGQEERRPRVDAYGSIGG